MAYAGFTALGGVGAALALIPLAALAWQALSSYPNAQPAEVPSATKRPSKQMMR